MGRITRAVHLSWDEDGSEQDAAGPVQTATLPWFEADVDTAGRGTWAGEFTLSNGTLRHDTDTEATDSFITLARSGNAVNTARTYFSESSGHAGDAGQLLLTQAGGVTFAVTALPDQSGLSVFRHNGGTRVTFRDTLNDTTAHNLADPTGLASVTYAGTTYVYATSSNEPGISIFRLSTSGQLSPVEDLDADDGLWASNITRLAATTVDGAPFVLVAGAGSGLISVAAVGDAGRLTVVDHVLDNLGTRFDDITVLETLVVGPRTYVATSGGDDGVSLFSLLPNGQLVHLDTLEDTQTLGLSSISALSLSLHRGDVHLIAASESEAGLTHLTYDPGSGLQLAGSTRNDTLTGGTSADILLDGAGDDRMTGGGGADLFVLAADGQRDTITDFRIGTDRIDVSAWQDLYSTHQLEVRTQSWGADIRYGNERLILRSDNGSSIDIADLVATDVFGIAQLLPFEDRPENQFSRTGTNEGNALNNIFRGMAGNDQLLGMNGNDRLIGGDGRDILKGGGGSDTLEGEASNDVLYGGEGSDRLLGGTGDDTLYGDAGNDVLEGDSASDVLNGGGGRDTLHGGTGDDALYGSEGRDALFGDEGNDQIYGNIGADMLHGGGGNDALYDASGDDLLVGGNGNDGLFGAQGRDTLEGGTGDDFLRGGTLGDTFIFNLGHDRDTISNLEWLDQIHLSRDLTGGLTSARDIVNTFQTTVGSDVALVFNSNDRIVFDTDVTTAELIEVIYSF